MKSYKSGYVYFVSSQYLTELHELCDSVNAS